MDYLSGDSPRQCPEQTKAALWKAEVLLIIFFTLVTIKSCCFVVTMPKTASDQHEQLKPVTFFPTRHASSFDFVQDFKQK